MAQSSQSDSKVRLQSLSTSLSNSNETVLKNEGALKVADATQDKMSAVSAEQIATETIKNPIESFDKMRDPHKSMLQLMDGLFDLLQIQAYEINQKNGDSNFQFHIQRPVLEKRSNNKSWLNTDPELPEFSGKIYSHDWSLVLKGTSEIIRCYVLPSDRVISLNTNGEIYKPYLSILFVRKGANYGWQIDSETIKQEHLPDIATKLFAKLVKSRKNQLWNESTLCLSSIGIKQGDAEKNNSPTKNNIQTKPHDAQQILKEMMQAAEEDAALINETKTAESIAKIDKQTNSANKVISASSHAFDEALNATIILLDKKLEELVDEGAQALSKHEFRRAQTILNLTNLMNELKDKANEILLALKTK